MTAREIIDTLNELVEIHGDKVIFADDYEVSGIDYNVADDCFDIY